jgi:hypothetical protein
MRLPTVAEYTDFVNKLVHAVSSAKGDDAKLKAVEIYSREAVENTMHCGLNFASRPGRIFLGKGGYLGRGPPPTDVNDEIWILENSRIPFVLRKTDNGENGETQYRLLGEAYVHGIMYNELFLGKTEEETPKFEEITIV